MPEREHLVEREYSSAGLSAHLLASPPEADITSRDRNGWSRLAAFSSGYRTGTVAIELRSTQATQLENEAKRLDVSLEELARAAVTDLLAAPDTAFQSAAKRILARNLELYRRLG